MLKKVLKLPKSVINFVKSIFTEFKFVEWIKRSDVVKYTALLMLFLVFGSIFILLIDRLLLLIRGTILQI